MKILLLRHGETDWNREPARCQGWADVGLNSAGRDQARDRGRALAGRGLELVITSHLLRSRETAEIVCAELEGPPLVVDPRLAETHRGEWETRLFTDIMRDDPERWRRYREQPQGFRFPGGESLADQQRRVLATLRDAARDGRRCLLVTHGGSVRVARCFLEGRGLAAFHEFGADNGDVREVPEASLVERITEFLVARD